LLRVSIRPVPVVYSPHCFAYERHDVPPFARVAFRAVERQLARVQQTIAAVSPYEAELARALGGKASVRLTPNASLRRARAIRLPQRRQIVTVGRISPQKDPRFLVEVARIVGSRASFTWVGDGDTKSREELHEAGVRVTGWLTPEAAQAELDAADLYFHPARWESSPFALVEAAFSGLPVMTRSIPALRSLGYWQSGASPREAADEVLATFGDLERSALVVQATADARRQNSPEIAATAIREAYSEAVRVCR